MNTKNITLALTCAAIAFVTARLATKERDEPVPSLPSARNQALAATSTQRLLARVIPPAPIPTLPHGERTSQGREEEVASSKERKLKFRRDLDQGLSNSQPQFMAAVTSTLEEDVRSYLSTHPDSEVVSHQCGGNICKIELRHASQTAADALRRSVLDGEVLNKPDAFSDNIGCNVYSYDFDTVFYIQCRERGHDS